MYGIGSIRADDHKFLPFLKRYPNQIIFVLKGFQHGELESEGFYYFDYKNFSLCAGSISAGYLSFCLFSYKTQIDLYLQLLYKRLEWKKVH